mgnify:CR=1 FL=1
MTAGDSNLVVHKSKGTFFSTHPPTLKSVFPDARHQQVNDRAAVQNTVVVVRSRSVATATAAAAAAAGGGGGGGVAGTTTHTRRSGHRRHCPRSTPTVVRIIRVFDFLRRVTSGRRRAVDGVVVVLLLLLLMLFVFLLLEDVERRLTTRN